MPGRIDQAELDALFTAALETAIARIETDGTFFPLLFELRTTGSIQNVAVLETGTIEGIQAVLDRLVGLIRSRAAEGMVRAAAIVLHAAEREAIELRLRARNYSSDLTVPYEIRRGGLFGLKRKLVLGEIAQRKAANEIF